MYRLRIGAECWIAPWDGDPGRTLIKESAKTYETLRGANIAKTYYEKRYQWRKLKIIVEVTE